MGDPAGTNPTANTAANMKKIKPTDNQIDKLVYELYGLSDDEIGVVEGKELFVVKVEAKR